MEQFKRKYELTVGEIGVEGVRSTQLQVTFKITKSSDTRSKNVLSLSIYNLNEDSRNKLVQDAVVVFRAGYEGSPLHIAFLGQIMEVSTVPTNGDVITTITASEGYAEDKVGFSTRKFPAGSTVQAITETLFVEDLGSSRPVYSNGTLGDAKGIHRTYKDMSIVGTTIEVIEEVLDNNFLTYARTGDKVEIYPSNGATSTIVVKRINRSTGMVGSPTRLQMNSNKPKKTKQSLEGYRVKFLLDPVIGLGHTVHINSSHITNVNGLFKVDKILHTGDFRGSTWYTELEVSVPDVDE